MDVIVVLVVVAIIVAALATYVYLASRGKVEAVRPLPVPKVPGLKLKPLVDVAPGAVRPSVEAAVVPAPRVATVAKAAPTIAKDIAPVTKSAPPVTKSAPPVTKPVSVAKPSSAPLFDIDLEPVVSPAPPIEIRWCRQFDPRSGTLDETARLRLIGDLGVVAKEWCVPLLSQAYEEERRPGHRQAALIALSACRSRAATATFRVALASNDAAERAIAADGLADLEPPPPAQNKPRRIVERH